LPERTSGQRIAGLAAARVSQPRHHELTQFVCFQAARAGADPVENGALVKAEMLVVMGEQSVETVGESGFSGKRQWSVHMTDAAIEASIANIVKVDGKGQGMAAVRHRHLTKIPLRALDSTCLEKADRCIDSQIGKVNFEISFCSGELIQAHAAGDGHR
jgi:hypothetical protein